MSDEQQARRLTKPYKEHLREQITNAKEATGYLSACFAEGPDTFALAVRDVWRFSQTRATELQREVDAQLMCNLCRRPSDYHPAAIDPEYGDWRHRRISHEKEWDEVCAAAAIRAAKPQ